MYRSAFVFCVALFCALWTATIVVYEVHSFATQTRHACIRTRPSTLSRDASQTRVYQNTAFYTLLRRKRDTRVSEHGLRTAPPRSHVKRARAAPMPSAIPTVILSPVLITPSRPPARPPVTRASRQKHRTKSFFFFRAPRLPPFFRWDAETWTLRRPPGGATRLEQSEAGPEEIVRGEQGRSSGCLYPCPPQVVLFGGGGGGGGGGTARVYQHRRDRGGRCRRGRQRPGRGAAGRGRVRGLRVQRRQGEKKSRLAEKGEQAGGWFSFRFRCFAWCQSLPCRMRFLVRSRKTWIVCSPRRRRSRFWF